MSHSDYLTLDVLDNYIFKNGRFLDMHILYVYFRVLFQSLVQLLNPNVSFNSVVLKLLLMWLFDTELVLVVTLQAPLDTVQPCTKQAVSTVQKKSYLCPVAKAYPSYFSCRHRREWQKHIYQADENHSWIRLL